MSMEEYSDAVCSGVDYRSEDLEPGAVLTRTYKGKTYVVFVVKPPDNPRKNRGWWRYEFDGKLHKSLSAIAALITGDVTLSGNRFFRLRRRRR